MIKTAGKQFDPHEGQIYFVASSPDRLGSAFGVNTNMLIAVNEITDRALALLQEFMAADVKLFIDSGVFNLTNEHARKHDCSMNDALGLAPDQIDGFDELFKKYVRICGSIGADSWGYIEIDQGGRENKIKTRAKLEKLGLKPIPVYHPLNDGWDYFDYLASRYDRICFANVVQADVVSRRRLITTAYMRRKRYPHLWIHLLGVTPSELTYSCPASSCDSSTWLNAIRWPDSMREKAAGGTVGKFCDGIVYRLDSPREAQDGHSKACKLLGMQAQLNGRNWRLFCERMESVNPITKKPEIIKPASA